MPLLEHPSCAAYFVGLIVYVAIRHRFERLASRRALPARIRDPLERVLLVLVGIGILLVPLVYLFSPWLALADHAPPGIVPWLGAGVMVVSLWLFYRAHVDLGVYWSITLDLRPDHVLVRHGVYRCLRHPMYASIWLWGIAQALLLPNWIAGLAGLLGFAALYFVRVPREEVMMRERFGAAYDAYAQHTGRVLPRFCLRRGQPRGTREL